MDPPDPVDYYGDEYLQDILEFRIAHLGGEPLVHAAQRLAASYVEATCAAWTGTGAEPGDRVAAYCAGLWWVAEGADSIVPLEKRNRVRHRDS